MNCGEHSYSTTTPNLILFLRYVYFLYLSNVWLYTDRYDDGIILNNSHFSARVADPYSNAIYCNGNL